MYSFVNTNNMKTTLSNSSGLRSHRCGISITLAGQSADSIKIGKPTLARPAFRWDDRGRPDV